MRYALWYWTHVSRDPSKRAYTKAAEGEIGQADPDAALEELFMLFNGDRRPFPIRSLSVDDVVVLEDSGAWICLPTGWAPAWLSEDGSVEPLGKAAS